MVLAKAETRPKAFEANVVLHAIMTPIVSGTKER